MDHAHIECLSLTVLENVVDVLYCYWKKPPEYLYTPRGIHTHAFVEAHYTAEASKTVLVEGRNVVVHPGEALLIAPNVLHASGSASCRDMTFVYNLHAPKNGLEALVLGERYRIVQGVNACYIEEIRREFALHLPGYQEKMKMLFQLALIDLARQCGGTVRHSVEPLSNQQYGLLIERYISTSISGVGDADGSSNSKKQLALALNLSLRQLERIVRSMFGMSYRELYNQHKFTLARQLLTDMDVKVKDVASFLGYSDEANFSRAFKNYFGSSPAKMSHCDAKTEDLSQ